MTESDMIARAKQYMEALSQGVNPLTGTPLLSGECASEERMKRCFAFTAQVLDKAYNDTLRKEYRTVRRDISNYHVSAEELSKFEYSDDPVGINKIRERFNALVDRTKVKPLKVTSITAFLLGAGLLAQGENEKYPTEAGMSVGITYAERTDPYTGRTYRQVVYTRAAQQFLVDNIDALCTLNAERQTRVALNGGAVEDDV